MLDHLSIQCADVTASAAFYDAVLAPLGGGRIMDFGTVIGYGVGGRPDFWIGPRQTGEGFRESHIAFEASATRTATTSRRCATGPRRARRQSTSSSSGSSPPTATRLRPAALAP
ncbi:MAG TPA: hypothetical protein VFH45_13150 [Acidimicrobiales bacterium]|nr:hypothetical protein [Acidimicrobiales bacterium]